MLKRYLVLTLVLGCSVALTSCEKLETAEAPQAGDFQDSIALDYGTLIAVTAHPESGHWAQLWFEKPDKTISAVWVNVVEGQIGTVATIPRK